MHMINYHMTFYEQHPPAVYRLTYGHGIRLEIRRLNYSQEIVQDLQFSYFMDTRPHKCLPCHC